MTSREQWLKSLEAGELVLAETALGFWMRARVKAPWSTRGLRVEYGAPEADHWLPRFMGLAEGNESTLPAERVAALPPEPPATFPAPGPVAVHYAGSRIHSAELVAIEGDLGRVRFDEGDEEYFEPKRVLPRGAPDPAKVAELEARGFHVGTAVRDSRDGKQWNDGWISALGSGAIFIRRAGFTNGRWRRAGDGVRLGGRGKPPREHLRPSKGELQVGAHVRARWSDRVFYKGRIVGLRTQKGRTEADVAFDDGARQWVPEARIVVVEPAPPPLPQRDEPWPLGPERWTEGTKVLARTSRGTWEPARVERSAGRDVFVRWRTEGGWVGPPDLALPLPDDGHLPAKGTTVVEKPRRGEPATGRVGRAVGDEVELRRDDGAKVFAGRDVLFQRALPRVPIQAPDFAPVGAGVEVWVGSDSWVEAEVSNHGAYGVRVRVPEGTMLTVDPARLRPVPEPPPPPPPLSIPPPPPAPREPEPEPRPDEQAARLVRLIALAWARGGYRGGHGVDGARVQLPVDRGELLVVAHGAGDDLFTVEITAAVGVDGAPAVDGPMVRFAVWAKSLLGGATPQVEREAEDAVWAAARLPPSTRVARTGGALSVRVTHRGLPAPGDVLGWARAVHTRLLGEPMSA